MLDLAYHGYQTTTTNWDFLSYESMNSGLPKKPSWKTEKPGPKTQRRFFLGSCVARSSSVRLISARWFPRSFPRPSTSLPGAWKAGSKTSKITPVLLKSWLALEVLLFWYGANSMQIRSAMTLMFKSTLMLHWRRSCNCISLTDRSNYSRTVWRSCFRSTSAVLSAKQSFSSLPQRIKTQQIEVPT